MSKEEQRQLEEEAELEAKRRAAAAKDNAHERGINEMMYGRLEGPEDDGVWNDIPRPEFMDTVSHQLVVVVSYFPLLQKLYSINE